jgi:plasmid stabilization system protein ParE
MKLRWTRQAESQLLEIGRYIAWDKPGAARRWIEV